MVEMKVAGDAVSIGPVERYGLDTVVELYNSSEGYKYATGISFPVTPEDIDLKLDRLETSKNEFFSGIYVTGSGNGTPRLIGVISGILHENTLWIKLIAILPQFRYKGIGRAAVNLVLDYCKNIYNISDVLLSVIKLNESGMRFWLGLGFVETGRFTKMLFGDASPYEVVIMQRKL